MHSTVVRIRTTTAVQVPRTSMSLKRKRVRPQTAQQGFPARFGGDGRLAPRMFGHIQGDGHAYVNKTGDSIVLGAACEDHGEEMALALSPCECERSLDASVAYVLSSRGRELDDVQKDPEVRSVNTSGNRQKFRRQHQERPFHWATARGS